MQVMSIPLLYTTSSSIVHSVDQKLLAWQKLNYIVMYLIRCLYTDHVFF